MLIELLGAVAVGDPDGAGEELLGAVAGELLGVVGWEDGWLDGGTEGVDGVDAGPDDPVVGVVLGGGAGVLPPELGPVTVIRATICGWSAQ